LHKIVDGGTDKSFGIEVARLAGVPKEVIGRAKERMQVLQNFEFSFASKDEAPAPVTSVPKSVRALAGLNADTLTPIEALNIVYAIKQELEVRP
ncbi:MAG TPA: DNA mismatch repair protein MutS, partial [Clostridiales bacterium]|nr:DNA mismatch repair protein MutS [Clostridiales bacterium]